MAYIEDGPQAPAQSNVPPVLVRSSGTSRRRRRAASSRPVRAPQALMPGTDRLQQIQLSDFEANRRSILQDLASQIAAQNEQWGWREQELGRRRGEIQTTQGLMRGKLPEDLGRLGSSYAARGSYSSGARAEAESDLTQQVNTQIGDLDNQIKEMQTQFEQAKRAKDLEQADLNLRAQRALEDLKRQEEATQIEWAMQAEQARQQHEDRLAARAASRASSRASRAAESAANADKNRSEASAYRDARMNIYRSQGASLSQAQAKAIQDMRQRYPNLDETWLYAGDMGFISEKEAKAEGGKRWGRYDIAPERGREITASKQASLRKNPKYAKAKSSIEAFLRQGGGTQKALYNYLKNNPKAVSSFKSSPQMWSVAWADARGF